MQPKTLKIFACVFLALAAAWGGLLALQNKPSPKNLLWEKARDAKRITLAGAAQTVTLVRTEEGWSMQAPFKYKADSSKVDDFLGKLAAVTVSETLSSDPSRQGYFEVTASSGVRLEGFLDAGDAKPALDVIVGKSGADYDDVMLRRPDSAEVFEGRGVARGDFQQKPSEWLDKTFVKIETGAVASIELRRKNDTLKLAKSGDAWHLNGAAAAVSTAAVASQLQPMLDRLSRLDADDILARDSAPAAALKSLRTPELRLIVRYKEGVAANAEERTLELTVAAKDKESRQAILKKGDDGLVFMASDWRLSPFEKKASDFPSAKAGVGGS